MLESMEESFLKHQHELTSGKPNSRNAKNMKSKTDVKPFKETSKVDFITPRFEALSNSSSQGMASGR